MGVSGVSPGRLFGRLILPDARAVGTGLPGLPGSCHSELLPPSPSGQPATAVALLLHSLALPGFIETFAVGVLTVSSAPDSERRTPLGCSSCSVSFLPPLLLLPWWLVGAAARGLASRFFPLPFPWSLRYSVVNGWGAGMGLPYRVVPFFSYRVACLRSSGGGQ